MGVSMCFLLLANMVPKKKYNFGYGDATIGELVTVKTMGKCLNQALQIDKLSQTNELASTSNFIAS